MNLTPANPNDRAFARCEAAWLREPDYGDLSDDELRAIADEEMQRALDDTDPRHVAAAVALGAASLRAHLAAVQHMPWERAWTTADAVIGGAR